MLSSGASSASQRAIGTGVLGGIITGTVLAVFFVPVFFVIVRTLFKGKKHAEDINPPEATAHNPEALRHD
ncbi:putative efflux pump membrane transporter TtgB [compost metagenome]